MNRGYSSNYVGECWHYDSGEHFYYDDRFFYDERGRSLSRLPRADREYEFHDYYLDNSQPNPYYDNYYQDYNSNNRYNHGSYYHNDHHSYNSHGGYRNHSYRGGSGNGYYHSSSGASGGGRYIKKGGSHYSHQEGVYVPKGSQGHYGGYNSSYARDRGEDNRSYNPHATTFVPKKWVPKKAAEETEAETDGGNGAGSGNLNHEEEEEEYFEQVERDVADFMTREQDDDLHEGDNVLHQLDQYEKKNPEFQKLVLEIQAAVPPIPLIFRGLAPSVNEEKLLAFISGGQDKTATAVSSSAENTTATTESEEDQEESKGEKTAPVAVAAEVKTGKVNLPLNADGTSKGHAVIYFLDHHSACVAAGKLGRSLEGNTFQVGAFLSGKTGSKR